MNNSSQEKLRNFGTYAWQNGEIKPVAEAQVHIMSNAVQYGTGAFEGIRAHATEHGPAIFRLQDHLRRLMYSTQCLRRVPPFTVEELTKGCRDLIRMNGFDACYLRPFVYSGVGDLGLTPPLLEAGIGTIPMSTPAVLKGQISEVRRLSPRAFQPDAKLSGHYVNSINAMADVGRKHPGTTPLLLDEDGHVAEMSAANVFLVLGNELHTPKAGSILPGMTRDTVKTLAEAEGVKVFERDIEPSELAKADELFATGTAVGVVPMTEWNGEPVRGGVPGTYTTRFATLYKDIVEGRAPEYRDWLTYVRE